MIFVGAAFAVLLLAIFYFASKTEGVRKELTACQTQLNNISNDNKSQAEVISLLADEYQRHLTDKLALVKQTRGDLMQVKVAEAIVGNSTYVIQDMVYKNLSIKQAVERNLGRSGELTAEQMHNFFVDQSHALKQAWAGTHVRQHMDLCRQLIELADS
ncbi:hypothetical protein DS2_02865 [Catenovulum agarivorans DS-2]|uniref:DUF2489 domain-containing protein n=1 Tax=Catenovulum agarivorans DS-2 TaxID=1328313 RepID=W7R275_9ALTE|nr:hypothetical protein [Catenovulum agarivorans]EWH11730.1 hypothetical protein DS2_02865 [Catenovulum agarivorans DS-2]